MNRTIKQAVNSHWFNGSRAWRLVARLVFLLWVFAMFAVSANAKELTFTVAEPSGAERAQWPVQGGVPFARGDLADPGKVALFDDAGQAVPLQTAPLAKWWDDGSVKWLLLDFFADLPSSGSRQYTLKYAEDVAPAKTDAPLSYKKTDNGVMIDTGALRAEIGPRLIHSLSVKNDKGEWVELIDRPGELWMTVNGQNEGRYAASLAKDATVEIEEEGQNRLSVLVKGTHTSHDGRTFGPYILRVNAYAGKPYLRVYHTFVNSDLPERGLITGIGLRLPFEYGEGATVSYGGLTEKATGGWPGWIEEVDGDKQVVIHDGQHRDLDGRLNAYLAVSSPKGMMACFGRHWRKLYPKKMDIANNGLTVWFWPASRGAFDLRREEQKQTEKWLDYKNNHPDLYEHWHDPGFKPSTVGVNMHRYYQRLERGDVRTCGMSGALGLSRTHEMFLLFKPGDLDTAELDNMSHAVEEAPRPHPAPEYMSSTLVLGPFGAEDRKNFPKTENFLALKLDWIIKHQNKWARWWGILDYGGTQSYYERLHKDYFPKKWHEMAGRYGWHNGEVDIPASVLFSYLRSHDGGNLRWWRFFESMARHQMDVDTMHANPPEYGGPDFDWSGKRWMKGGLHRHSYNHYSGAPNDQHTWNEGLVNYYFLTGDRRAREVSLELAEYNYGSPIGKVPTAFEANHAHERIWRRYGRNVVNVWRTSLKAYEMTGEDLWREDCERWREHFLKGFMDYLNSDEKISTYQQNHYMAQTLLIDYYMSGDERVGKLLAELGAWNVNFMKQKHTDRGLHWPFLACGGGWHVTRDQELLQWPFHCYLSEFQDERRRAKHNDFTKGQFYIYYQLPFFISACREAGYSESNPPPPIPEGIEFPAMFR